MATMLSLQQALKSLCSKTGWCYAVFWKLKRRSRMMLTWEDGYCDYSRSYGDGRNNANHVYNDKGGNPLDQGGSGDLEGQISLAVARMSYYVYSMGEGVIGRVAFTGKYQWAFHDAENHLENSSGCNLSNQYASDKSPDGWQNQFVAGIKTIAVIAVSQGVVQLGSSKLMKEDTKWIDHVKSVFSALQTTPSAPRPEPVLEEQARSLYTNKSTVSGLNACSLTRKSIAAQHNQFALRNAGDPMELQKLGAQESPAVVASMHGKHSIGGPISVSRAIGQELKFQQSEKVLAEPQHVKNSQGVRVSQANKRNLNDLLFAVPSTGPKCILLSKNSKSPSTEEFRLGNPENELTWASLVAEGLPPSDVHDNSPGCHVLSTCRESSVDKFFSHMQDDSSLKKKLAMCSMPERIKDETFSSGIFRAHQEQHQINCSNAKDATLTLADFSCGASEIVSNQYIDDLANITSADIASQFPATRDVPIGMPSVVQKPEICQYENGRKLCANGGSTDLTTLEEIEKLLSSFCKEEITNRDSSYAIGDELSQALGPAFWKGDLDDLQNPARKQRYKELASLASKEDEKLPTVPAEEAKDWGSGLGSKNLHENFTSPVPLEDKSELLLDAVVGIANNLSLNRNASFDVKMSLNRCKEDTLSTSQETIHDSSLSGKLMMQTVPHHEVGSYNNLTGALRNLQSHQNVCVSSDTLTTASVQSWTDDVYSLKSDDSQRAHSQSKRSEELSKSSKKRSRSGENVRPRPKDRQQIQDRVRELRDIVPSGSKCSIDALLEKTIKHMLFLHSVTLHAEQLKNIADLKEDSDNGASWAFDLGSQEKQIPIVVKDLNQPRQMLVEMICEESGLFLETADVIRNLGLKILRGSMDFYEDRYLARFIVEANREIRRVDVLVSLIQQLHLDNNSSCSSMTMASQSTAVKP